LSGILQPPRLRAGAWYVWRRNVLVWRKLMLPAILMNFGEPAIYLLGLGFGLGHFVGSMAGIPYAAFLASGIIASSAMNTASFEGMYSVFTRMVPQKTYEAILATPIEVDDIMSGEMLWCATKALISGTAILIVSAALGAVHSWQSLLVLPVVFLIGLCFAGPALIMSALAESYDFFSYYFVLFITPMFILCGVFYPVDTLPHAIHNLVQFLPLTHGVYLTRSLVAGKELAQPWLHVSILLAYAAASYWIAVILVRRKLLV
jgi:lipooligosaccharide transport system permease protein